jgi:hypothetical protein
VQEHEQRPSAASGRDDDIDRFLAVDRRAVDGQLRDLRPVPVGAEQALAATADQDPDQ